MKAVIGIDCEELLRPALSLFARLRFAASEAIFVHSVQSCIPDGTFPAFSENHPLDRLMDEREAAGKELLAGVSEQLQVFGIPAPEEIRRGDPFKSLAAVADEAHADLIVA